MNLENIKLSERSQSQNYILHDSAYVESLEQANPWRKNVNGYQGLGVKGNGDQKLMDVGVFWGVTKMP